MEFKNAPRIYAICIKSDVIRESAITLTRGWLFTCYELTALLCEHIKQTAGQISFAFRRQMVNPDD